MTHTILKSYSALRYYPSKWERSVGDTLNYDGEKMEVVFIGTEQVCKALIKEIARQMRNARARLRYAQEKQAREWLINELAKSGAEIGLSRVEITNVITQLI